MPPAFMLCCKGMELTQACAVCSANVDMQIHIYQAPTLLIIELRAQELYGHLPRVRTPRIVWAHTTRRVLTMVQP